MSLLPGIGAGDQSSTGFYDYEIENSMLFNGSGGLRLSSGEANTSYWTLSVWIKRHKLGGNYSTIMSASNYGSTYQTDVIGFGSANTMFSIRGSNANSFSSNAGTALVTDTSNWYHYCLRNSNGTVTRWLNGVQDSTYSVGGTFIGIGRSGNHDIGAYGGQSVYYNNNFSLADLYFVNDSGFGSSDVYDWTQFAEFKNGVLVPKENSLTAAQIGDGGCFLEFKQTGSSADASGIGADTSGNGHHCSVLGTVSDFCKARKDSPTNNFCTINPRREYLLVNGSVTLSEGNTTSVDSGTTYGVHWTGTHGMSSGKWYWEVLAHTLGGNYANIGVVNEQTHQNSQGTGIHYGSDGKRNPHAVNSGITNYGASYGNGDIIGVAFDADNETITFYKNNASQGAVASILTQANGPYFPCVGDAQNSTTYKYVANWGQDGTFAGNKTAQGNTDENGIGNFYYAPPSGYLALCNANLPEPTIGPNETETSTNHFNTILYTGNQTARSETGVGFAPDLVWIKGRNATWSNSWFDTVRGADRIINSDWEPQAATSEERVVSFALTSFDSDGFSLGGGTELESRNQNNSGTNFVAWNWRAGGAPTASNSSFQGAAPTSGAIMVDGVTSTASLPTAGRYPNKMSVNTKAGFSIVAYTGNGNSAFTIPHGLTKAPEMVIIKNRDTSPNGQWVIGQNQSGFTGQMYFSNLSFSTNSGSFGNTAPTSSLVNIGTDNTVNEGSDDFIMYCFHSVEGFSKIGSYDGNGSTDGVYVYTGFRPAWIMIKTYNQNVTWFLVDNKRESYNGSRKRLLPSQYNTETGNYVELYSNGFKWISGSGTNSFNGTNYSYVYLAFAEQPFKYSNAGGR